MIVQDGFLYLTVTKHKLTVVRLSLVRHLAHIPTARSIITPSPTETYVTASKFVLIAYANNKKRPR
jgi:hypothetical protein